MQANYVQRVRLVFSKVGATRFIGHLDVARTLERILNRAKIPVSRTQGFNTRPRMQLATAIPLGFTSECELVDIWLEEWMEPNEVLACVQAKTAPGMDFSEAREVPLKQSSLQAMTVESTYLVTPLDPIDPDLLRERVADLLAQEEHVRVRLRGKKKKQYDLRPLIFDLQVQESEPAGVQLLMRLSLAPAATGRPDEVLDTLGIDPLAARVHRLTLVLDEDES